MSTFSDWADLVHGPDRDWGQLSCGCHPNCGIGMALMIDKETKEAVPVTAFLNADRLAKDVAKINDAARGKFLSIVGVSARAAPQLRPDASRRRTSSIMDLLQKFDKCFGATGRNYGKVTADRTMADIEKRRADRWNFLFIAGMWFQDLFNYDFRRTEQCIIPYATQEGEISFCAYNTGVGWRNIIEKMHMTSTLTKWYEEHGRHEIFAGGKKVGIDDAGQVRPASSTRSTSTPPPTTPSRSSASPRTRAKRRSAPATPRSSRTPKTPAWPSSTARKSSRSPRSPASSPSARSSPPPPHPRRKKTRRRGLSIACSRRAPRKDTTKAARQGGLSVEPSKIPRHVWRIAAS